MATVEISDKHLHEEQRNRVIALAGKMFAELGIRKVRMDDVAAALTISKRTLYEMFADKEELLLECIKVNHERKHEYAAQVAERANNVLEIVFSLYQNEMEVMKENHPSVYRDIKKYPKVCEYINQRKAQNSSKNKEFYKEGVRQGLFRADINFDIFQFLTDLSISGFLNDDMLMERWTLAEVLDTVVRVHMRGICTEKGQRMLDDFLREK